MFICFFEADSTSTAVPNPWGSRLPPPTPRTAQNSDSQLSNPTKMDSYFSRSPMLVSLVGSLIREVTQFKMHSPDLCAKYFSPRLEGNFVEMLDQLSVYKHNGTDLASIEVEHFLSDPRVAQSCSNICAILGRIYARDPSFYKQ